jgi:hypothetical protein
MLIKKRTEMNTVKYYAELSLTPIVFTLYLLQNLRAAVIDAWLDTRTAVRDTHRKYGR